MKPTDEIAGRDVPAGSQQQKEEEAARVDEQTVMPPERATALETPGKSEPSPLPWSAGPPAWFRGQRDPEDGKRPITAGAHGVVGNVYGKANAEFIVRCVNSHADLVAALKQKEEELARVVRECQERGTGSTASDNEVMPA